MARSMKMLSLFFCGNIKITCEKCTGFTASFLSPSKFKSPGSPQRSEYISMYANGGSATTKCDTIFSSRPLAGQQKDIHILYNLSSLKGLCVKKCFI